jgi:hypothetical protein
VVGKKTYSFRSKRSQILQRLAPIPNVLDLDAQIVLMPLILLRQEHRLLEEPSLATNPDGRLEIVRKLDRLLLAVAAEGGGGWSAVGVCGSGLDERFETVDVAGFGVAVEEEGRVVRGGEGSGVEFLQIDGEVVDPLGVKELRRVSLTVSINLSRDQVRRKRCA